MSMGGVCMLWQCEKEINFSSEKEINFSSEKEINFSSCQCTCIIKEL